MRKFMLGAPLALLAAPAFAQDTAPREEPFTGAYVGGSFGYTVQPSDGREGLVFDTNRDGDFTDTVRTSTGADAFSPGFCNGFQANPTRDLGCKNDKDDIEYYGRVGFDKQFGSIVVGVVGEAGRSQATDSVTGFSTTPASYTLTRTTDWNAGLRGRVGYTPGTTLFYATGGGAYARMDNKFRTTNTANGFGLDRKSDAWGWSAGGGVEQLIGRNFSVGLEYLFTSLKDDDQVITAEPGSAPASNPFLLVDPTGTDFRRSDRDFNTHSMRATASFRF